MRSKIWIVIALVLVLTIIGLGTPADEVAGSDICRDELGGEWVAIGVAKHDDWERYHVRCERDTGVLTSEQKWVTIRPAEWPEDGNAPLPI